MNDSDNIEYDRRIIELADQFEEAWNAGQRISVDDFLARCVGEEAVDPALRDELRLVEQELQQKYPEEPIKKSASTSFSNRSDAAEWEKCTVFGKNI